MYVKAYETTLSILQAEKERANPESVYKYYNTLGNLQKEFKNYNKSLFFLYKALESSYLAKDTLGTSGVKNNLAQVYLLSGNLDSAKKYLYESQRIKSKSKQLRSLSNTQSLIGDLYFKLKNLDSAEFYYKKSLDIRLIIGDSSKVSSSIAQIARIETHKGNFHYSDSLLSKAERLSLRDSINGTLPDIAKIRIEWSEALGDPKEISKWYRIKDSLQQKIYGIEKQEAIDRMQIEFDVEQNQKALAQEEEKSQLLEERNAALFRTNSLLIGGVILLILFSISMVYLLNINRKNNRQLRAQGVQLEKQAEQIQVLHQEYKHRTSNHFSMISAMFQIHDKASESQLLSQVLQDYKGRVDSLSMINRHLVNPSGEKEVVDMSSYLDELIQNTELGYTSSKSVSIQNELRRFSLPSSLAMKMGIMVHELMTNFFKYALENNPSPELIILTLFENNQVFLKVQDNGPGLKDAQSSSHSSTGFGLRLIQTFVHELDGEISLSSDEGFKVEITFPFLEKS
ncbi:tetratricopeptide repeat protein [bacterium SCSIO 12741]|nr:tetratricopeptide repeat protein [bacterium SCSIO 12741]